MCEMFLNVYQVSIHISYGRQFMVYCTMYYYCVCFCMYGSMKINSGMRLFRNYSDLRGHSRGNPRSGLIFMGGGEGYHKFCVVDTSVLMLAVFNIFNNHHKFTDVFTISTCTSIT